MESNLVGHLDIYLINTSGRLWSIMQSWRYQQRERINILQGNHGGRNVKNVFKGKDSYVKNSGDLTAQRVGSGIDEPSSRIVDVEGMRQARSGWARFGEYSRLKMQEFKMAFKFQSVFLWGRRIH